MDKNKIVEELETSKAQKAILELQEDVITMNQDAYELVASLVAASFLQYLDMYIRQEQMEILESAIIKYIESLGETLFSQKLLSRTKEVLNRNRKENNRA